jgi:hypothetical protein
MLPGEAKLSAVRGLSRPYPLAVTGRDPVYSVISHPPTFNLKYQAASGKRERRMGGWERVGMKSKRKKGRVKLSAIGIRQQFLSSLSSA